MQRAGRALALADKRGHLGAIAVDVADDASLHAHGVLQTANRIFPTAARVGDKLGVGRRQRDIAVLALERLVDLADLEREILSLPEKLLRALDVLLELLERAMRQARKVAGLIDEHLRLVLEALNLVVDLLQSPRCREDVLRVVARVIDDAAEAELRMGRACQHGRKRDGHGERQREG